jgi:hypothetical protein
MKRKQRNQSGSAVVEFVLLAIPLFLPILIYLTQFSEVSGREIASRTLVREIVRAYVSADSESAARDRSLLVMDYAAQRLGFDEQEISSMQLSFSCSAQSCFTAGAKVRATLRFQLSRTHRQVLVTAQEYVSPWQ